MSKTGLLLLRDDPSSRLSPHFGMAKWIAIFDPDSEELRFLQNRGLNGRAVTEVLEREGCSDVIFASIGSQALDHLKAARIRGWYGPKDQSPAELLRLLKDDQLQLAEASTHDAPRRHRRHDR
ncbi:MAG: NifB/NifX family molybdenum-iron cluster-binding protein [Myxococcales bacterium]|jgi:predicted Fe-Mo cluster-binding NifX family protein